MLGSFSLVCLFQEDVLFLAESLFFTVSKLMPEKYSQSKTRSIFKPKPPSWLEASSLGRCPCLPPRFPGTASQESGSRGPAQGGFCGHEQSLDGRAGASASRELILAASVFPSSRVQGAEEECPSPDSPRMMLKYPGAGGWAAPTPAVNPSIFTTLRAPATLP